MVVDLEAREQRTDRALRALADGTRRDIVARVLRREHSVSNLAEKYAMSFAAVQKHVAVLERAGLVTKQRRGRQQLVRGDIDSIRRASRAARPTRSGVATPHGPVRRRARRTEEGSSTMTVTQVRKDPEALTMSIEAEFDAPAKRVWELWEDPRQLEQWWGPPGYPATFVDHDLTPGGRTNYFMTGPGDARSHGWWLVRTVDVPRRLEFEDGFADATGAPDPNMPTMIIRVTIDEQSGGATHMVIETSFPSRDVMDQMVTMGMDEGMRAAMGQIDAVLAG